MPNKDNIRIDFNALASTWYSRAKRDETDGKMKVTLTEDEWITFQKEVEAAYQSQLKENWLETANRIAYTNYKKLKRYIHEKTRINTTGRGDSPN